mmetsp:Transcript_60911/g.108162  ORF Transcript_60911/g.108162 Transcript_60911/m.108162 type:complete len:214 (-) Transcript_60911:24-665(-)
MRIVDMEAVSFVTSVAGKHGLAKPVKLQSELLVQERSKSTAKVAHVFAQHLQSPTELNRFGIGLFDPDNFFLIFQGSIPKLCFKHGLIIMDSHWWLELAIFPEGCGLSMRSYDQLHWRICLHQTHALFFQDFHDLLGCKHAIRLFRHSHVEVVPLLCWTLFYRTVLTIISPSHGLFGGLCFDLFLTHGFDSGKCHSDKRRKRSPPGRIEDEVD